MPPCLRIKGSVGIQALYSYSLLYSPFLHLNKGQFAWSWKIPHHEPPLTCSPISTITTLLPVFLPDNSIDTPAKKNCNLALGTTFGNFEKKAYWICWSVLCYARVCQFEEESRRWSCGKREKKEADWFSITKATTVGPDCSNFVNWAQKKLDSQLKRFKRKICFPITKHVFWRHTFA